MLAIFFIICMILITLGSLTKNPNLTSLFIFPIGVIALFFQKLVHKASIKNLGFRKCSLSSLVKAILLPLVIVFSIFLIAIILGLLEVNHLNDYKHPSIQGTLGSGLSGLAVTIITLAVITFLGALLSEELAFRGYILSRLKKFDRIEAILLSSVLFGIWHLPPSLFLLDSNMLESIVYIFNISFLGILAGYLFFDSGSLIPPSVFHGVWNAMDYTLFGTGKLQEPIFCGPKIFIDPDEGFIGFFVLLGFSLIAIWKTGRNDSISYKNK